MSIRQLGSSLSCISSQVRMARILWERSSTVREISGHDLAMWTGLDFDAERLRVGGYLRILLRHCNGPGTVFLIEWWGNIDGGLAADEQGNYYGTTYEGGASGFGSLFQYSSSMGWLTTLFSFDRHAHGSLPAATVTLDSKGNIYGTTLSGRVACLGTARP